MAESHLVLVRSRATEQRWPLTSSRRSRDWLLTITSPDGESWAAGGPDLFKALRALRRMLDPLGIRLGRQPPDWTGTARNLSSLLPSSPTPLR